MKRYKKIGVLSLARFQAILLALVGLICGIFYSVGGLLIDVLVTLGLLSPTSMSTPGLSAGTILAFGAIIGMPIIFASIGFLLGLVEGLLYNIFAKWFRHLRINLNLEK